jgi:hypothetical protein
MERVANQNRSASDDSPDDNRSTHVAVAYATMAKYTYDYVNFCNRASQVTYNA